MSPFGSHAKPHGTSRPEATVSTLKSTLLEVDEVSVEKTCPSGGATAGLQPKRHTDNKNMFQNITFSVRSRNDFIVEPDYDMRNGVLCRNKKAAECIRRLSTISYRFPDAERL
jgi:hypothetical protein